MCTSIPSNRSCAISRCAFLIRAACTTLKLLFFIGWTEFALADVALNGDAARIPRYGLFEAVSTSAKTHGNRFQDVTITATFTSPSGRKLMAYGFHDGGTIWRVRIAPDEPGQWRYVTTASDSSDSGLHQQAGSFQCVPSSHKGIIRADPRRPYYFVFSDGTPFFALGDTFTLTSPTLSETNRQAYLQARAGKPFNFLRIFASYTFNAWTGQPHASVAANPGELWPWGGTPAAPDYDRLNPRYFQRFEKILSELKARGLFAEIIVCNYYESPFKTSAWTPAREHLWVRYLVSRLAADPTVFLWTVAQEYERYPDGQYRYAPADDDWVRRIGKLIRESDPHQHPRTVHPWGGHGPAGEESVVESGAIGQRFGRSPELDVLTHQHNSYGTAVLVRSPPPGYQDGSAAGVEKALWADRQYHKPVINTEYGYEWLKDYPANFNSQAHGTDKCRRAAWRIFTAGGAGLAAGFSGTYLASDNAEIYYDGAQRFAPLQIADMGHARQLQHLYDFVTQRTDFREMNPAQALVNAPNLCLANPGQEYVVYAPAGGGIALDLSALPKLSSEGRSGSAERFSVAWLDPRTGLRHAEVAFATQAGAHRAANSTTGATPVLPKPPSEGGRRIFVAPDTNDWVLHLKKSDR